jgi:hypothetical protein
MSRANPKIGAGYNCVDCGNGPLVPSSSRGPLRHNGRGLCRSCYIRGMRQGTLEANFPRMNYTSESLADEATRLYNSRRGWTWKEIASEFGVTKKAVEKARARARERQSR